MNNNENIYKQLKEVCRMLNIDADFELVGDKMYGFKKSQPDNKILLKLQEPNIIYKQLLSLFLSDQKESQDLPTFEESKKLYEEYKFDEIKNEHDVIDKINSIYQKHSKHHVKK